VEARFCCGCGENLESKLEYFLRSNQLEPLIKPLKENHFTTPDELHYLSDADFQELGVSLGLRIKLKTALQRPASAVDSEDGEAEEKENEGEGEQNQEELSARALAEELSRLSRIDRVYLAPKIPTQKLSVAYASYVKTPGVEVLLLYDVTVFGGAKDGLILAKNGLYLKESFQPACFFDYGSIRSVRADDNILRVNGQEVLNCLNIPAISVKRIANAISVLAGLNR
jgi:hypothetical protein